MLKWTINGRRQAWPGGRNDMPLAAGDALSIDLASGGHWYGHGFSHVQPYPLESGQVVNGSFAVNNIQCPLWLCSKGYAVLAETRAPLDVRLNENGSGALEIRPSQPTPVRVFEGPTATDVHRQAMRHLGGCRGVPEKRLFGDSIFCTWTQYPRCITQERVLGMAAAIRARGYPCSVLTIDDRWESCFGELSFAQDFPDPRGMVRRLHEMGFRVLLWVTPFVNREAKTFGDLAVRRILVPRRDGTGAALLKWWGGTAGLVDLTNPVGRGWFRERLLSLKHDVGVDGFKIDGGDAKYQPPFADSAWHDYRGAAGYADELLAVFEDVAPGFCETRTAWFSQERAILWRLGGKDSHWGLDNGLKAMVTLAQHVSLLGYDVLIPDMIPGRVQTLQADLPLPTDELMVRWTEASVFMPIMQFSYFPWNYESRAAEAVKAYALVHKALEDYTHCQAVGRMGPLLRPAWYDAPERGDLYAVADEFMLGSDLLAAPVVDVGATARDVRLPPGTWVDAWTGREYTVELIRNHPAPCPGIPVFVRKENREVFEVLSLALRGVVRGGIVSGKTSATYVAGLDRDLSVTG